MQYIAHFFCKELGKKLRVLPHDILLVGRVSQHQQKKLKLLIKSLSASFSLQKEIPGAQSSEHFKH